MSEAFKGPFPNVAVTISVQVDSGPIITKIVNLPNTSAFNVTQQATLQAPNDLRTAQHSLTYAEDPRLEVREADYPGYTVAIVERAIQQESGAGNWLTLDPTAVSAVGASVRFRARAQVYDATGATYEAPVDLYSAPVTVIAHVAPGNMAADGITLEAIASPSGTEAKANIIAYPAGNTGTVTGFDYSYDAGTTVHGTIQKPVGTNAILFLAASTPNQIVHVRARDEDGGTSTAWTQLAQTVSTLVGAETLTITPNRTTIAAPGGAVFAAEAQGFGVDDPYHKVYYRWSFGDPGHYTRNDTDDFPWDRVYDDAGTIKIVRGPRVYAADGETLLATQGVAPAVLPGATYLGPDKNRAYGPRVNHVWDTAGTYTVTCEANTRARIEAGLPWITDTQTVTVTAWQDNVAPSRVFCLRSNIAAGAEPVGAQVFTDYHAMLAAYRASSQPTAILFRRGGTHNATGPFQGWGNSKPSLCVVGAYGPEADGDPVLNFSVVATVPASDTSQLIYTGLEIKGPFDSTSQSAVRPYTNGIDVSNGTLGAHTTVWDCKLSGWNECIYIGKYVRNLVVGNIFVESWWNYGVYAGNYVEDCGINGYFAKQPKGTITGTGKQENAPEQIIADHGPFRCSYAAGAFSFHVCDLRSLNSWSGTYQPNHRLGGSGNGSVPLQQEGNLDRMRGEMNGIVGSGNYSDFEMPHRMVYDKIFEVHANSNGNSGLFAFGNSGYTVRNVLAVIANQKQVGSNYSSRWVNSRNEPQDPSNYEYGFDIYNCTFVDLRDSTNGPATMDFDDAGLARYAWFNFENNITSRPQFAGQNPQGPLDTTPLYQVDYPAFNFEMNAPDTSYAIPAGTPQSSVPLTGSPAIGSATGAYIAVDDFWGNERPAVNASKGAMEPV